ncbi:MAG: hypothetical protein WAW39_15980 [Prosthecobacter sp.]|uniref:hypothetical protein n=1 Tax=Prosthecobacter sp. TaxID=1965333 RepID=UPI003BB041BF
MTPFIQLLIRHLLASLGAVFAAHNITGDSTTSIVVGFITLAIPTLISWFGKVVSIDNAKAGALTGSEVFRALIGSLVSQGITALSVYFSIDANNPELLLGAIVNVGASKLGLHQKVMGLPGAVQALALMSVLSLSSCATSSALIASPFGRALIATADQLGKAVIETTQKVGLEQIILQASAKVAALKAEGIHADPVKEILRGSQISAFTDVIEAAQAKYQQLTGKRYMLPKNPVSVLQ